MKIWLAAMMAFSSFSTHALDFKFDRKDKFQGITVESGKTDNVRAYRTSFKQTLPISIVEAKAGIVNFAEKCNNQHRLRRQWIEASTNCAFTHDTMIETRVERNLLSQAPIAGETDRYILSRRGYDRGEQQYQELVREIGRQDEQGREVVEIRQEMLNDSTAPMWLSQPLKRHFAFETMSTTYTLTKISHSETELRFEHNAQTTHWLLNKALVVPQVFVTLTRGAQDMRRSLEGHYQRNRQLASQRTVTRTE